MSFDVDALLQIVVTVVGAVSYIEARLRGIAKAAADADAVADREADTQLSELRASLDRKVSSLIEKHADAQEKHAAAQLKMAEELRLYPTKAEVTEAVNLVVAPMRSQLDRMQNMLERILTSKG